MDDYSEVSEPQKPLTIRAYGVSGSTLKKEIESITGVNPGKNAIYSKETGRVSVTTEVFVLVVMVGVAAVEKVLLSSS